jgi:hypothetical protein
MRKLLHQVFGIWTTGRPYDPAYDLTAPRADDQATQAVETVEVEAAPQEPKKEAAGRKTGVDSREQAVTATDRTIPPSSDTVNESAVSPTSVPESIDYAYLRSQITMERVLDHLGYLHHLRGRGSQRRGPCPVHGTKRSRGRTFSVHLGKNVFQCFHPPCGASGNALDLWCAVHQLTLREGAIHLADTFGLQLRPTGTEKRNPSPEPVGTPPRETLCRAPKTGVITPDAP